MDATQVSKFTMVCIIALIMAIFNGCVILKGEAKAEMNALNKEISDLTTEGLEVKAQMERVIADFKAIQEKIKAGDTSEAMVQAIGVLTREFSEAQTHYNQITTKVVSAKERVGVLKDEHGVPWWQILIGGAISVASGLTGAGMIKGSAATAIGILANVIQSGASVDEMKATVRTARNPMIETALKKTGIVIK